MQTLQPCSGAQPSDNTEILSPEQYAAAIRHHADQTTETSLFPGHSFENLANYLQRTSSESTATRLKADNDFAFVKLLVLGPTLEPNEHYEFSQPPHLSNTSFGDLSRTQLLFLRGKPTAAWLNTLGARYMIDPAFFQRHLSFWSTVGRLEYFATQSLPSMQQNIISLPYITLGHMKRPLHAKFKSSLVTERKSSAKAMQSYWEAMYKAFDLDSDLGTSIIRDVQVHDQSHFSLEQRISVTLKKSGANAWQLFVWLDSGKRLDRGIQGPWKRLHGGAHGNRLLPSIQSRPFIALKSHQHCVKNPVEVDTDQAQAASLLHFDYGRTLDRSTMLVDPFYALHEIFEFVAASYCQYLNMLSAKTSKRSLVSSGESPWSGSDLLYEQSLLEATLRHLHDLSAIIAVRGNASWPHAATAESNNVGLVPSGVATTVPSQGPPRRSREDIAAAAAASLAADFAHLSARTERILASLRDAEALLMNRAMICEAEKTMAQAQQVTKLTQLAFVFIPLSFTATLFGMNVKPFEESATMPLWVWFAVSVPVLGLSIALMLWGEGWLRSWAALQLKRTEASAHSSGRHDGDKYNYGRRHKTVPEQASIGVRGGGSKEGQEDDFEV